MNIFRRGSVFRVFFGYAKIQPGFGVSCSRDCKVRVPRDGLFLRMLRGGSVTKESVQRFRFFSKGEKFYKKLKPHSIYLMPMGILTALKS